MTRRAATAAVMTTAPISIIWDTTATSTLNNYKLTPTKVDHHHHHPPLYLAFLSPYPAKENSNSRYSIISQKTSNSPPSQTVIIPTPSMSLLGILQAQAPPKQDATSTIQTLCLRLSTSTLLEDRRAAIMGLRSFAREYKETVASGGLRGLIGTLSKDSEDVDTIKVVLETLLLLFVKDESNVCSHHYHTSCVGFGLMCGGRVAGIQ